MTQMIIQIDFNSSEAIYMQLCNQIIMGIATSKLQEGDPLPSVRQMADTIGINMHTVNKAYAVLKPVSYTHLPIQVDSPPRLQRLVLLHSSQQAEKKPRRKTLLVSQ